MKNKTDLESLLPWASTLVNNHGDFDTDCTETIHWTMMACESTWSFRLFDDVTDYELRKAIMEFKDKAHDIWQFLGEKYDSLGGQEDDEEYAEFEDQRYLDRLAEELYESYQIIEAEVNKPTKAELAAERKAEKAAAKKAEQKALKAELKALKRREKAIAKKLGVAA